MIERRNSEFNLVTGIYGELEIATDLSWFVVKSWRLPAGWNKYETALLVQIPPGYPVTPPDNFYTDPDLLLGNGGQPGNSSAGQSLVGRQGRMFSYHVESGDWQPHAEPSKGHNLLTFLEGVIKRLLEAS
jgi:hypothetical protein